MENSRAIAALKLQKIPTKSSSKTRVHILWPCLVVLMHWWLSSRVIALILSGILCGIITEASYPPPDHILPPNNNNNNNAQAGPVNAANIWSNPDPVEIAKEMTDVYENYEPVPKKNSTSHYYKMEGISLHLPVR